MLTKFCCLSTETDELGIRTERTTPSLHRRVVILAFGYGIGNIIFIASVTQCETHENVIIMIGTKLNFEIVECRSDTKYLSKVLKQTSSSI